MRNIKDTLLQRRSVRRYEREPITDDQIQLIYDAIRNTPTSYNGQQFSVIDITDQKLKEQLYLLTNQKQIKTCSHFLVFVADYHKIALGAKAKQVEMPEFYNTMDGLMVGVIDAALAMMSAVAMAEGLGLGTCCIGYARTAAPKEFATLLQLPQHTAVVCGLAIGVPREQPDLKPKQPTQLVVHQNRYGTDSDTDATLTSLILDYDQLISHYNATRSGTTSTNDWVSHIISYYREAMNYQMAQAMRSQGFDIKR